MTAQQLIGLAVRLFAIWLALASIAFFTSVPAALAASQMDSGNAASIAIFIGGVYVLTALLLCLFPMLIAHKLLPRTQHADRLAFQGHELARVGGSLLGLWLFAKALPSLVWFFFRTFMMFGGSASAFTALAAEAKLDLAVAVFETAFALLIIFKSSTFARLVVPQTNK